MLKNSYDRITEDEVRQMDRDELINALIRIVNVKAVNSADYMPTKVYLPDDIADAFRGRI